MNKRSDSFYQNLSFNLVSLAILSLALFYGRDIILPLLFSALLANLLLPQANYLVKKRFPKSFSIMVPLTMTLIAGLAIIYFLSSQVMHFIHDVPDLKERMEELGGSFQEWLKANTNITIWKQNQYLDDTVNDLKDKAPEFVGKTFISVTSALSYVVFVPIYTFLILYYRINIKTFIVNLFSKGSPEKVNEVITESTTIAQRYITGLLIETILVFTLNTIGFLILGIKYAVFLALLAALLNLIPYVGMLVANVICMVITLISSNETTSVIWVAVILAIVQFLDNNFGMPLVVGNKVRINALVTIVGVLIGGALCGIPGMLLAIPGLALLKVIFDKVPDLKPWGVLLGDSGELKIKAQP